MVNRDICKILCPIPLSSLSAGQDLGVLHSYLFEGLSRCQESKKTITGQDHNHLGSRDDT